MVGPAGGGPENLHLESADAKDVDGHLRGALQRRGRPPQQPFTFRPGVRRAAGVLGAPMVRPHRHLRQHGGLGQGQRPEHDEGVLPGRDAVCGVLFQQVRHRRKRAQRHVGDQRRRRFRCEHAEHGRDEAARVPKVDPGRHGQVATAAGRIPGRGPGKPGEGDAAPTTRARTASRAVHDQVH